MNKKKEKKVKESFDLLSKEMAELIVNEQRDNIEKNMEKEIVQNERIKKKKESLKDNFYFNNKLKDSSESDDSIEINKSKLRRSNSKEDMRSFKPKENKIKSAKNINTNNNLLNKDNKNNNSNVELSFKANSRQNLEKIKKSELEVTNSPVFKDKKNEENKVNYYNIIYYIENTKRQEENKLNSPNNEKIKKANSLFSKGNDIKPGMLLKTKGSFKNSNKDKKEYSFLYEDQQNDDSENLGNYLEFLNSKRSSDKAILYTISKNNTFNKSSQDHNNLVDLDELTTTNDKNSFKKSNIIFNNYQRKKNISKSFFQKQITRQRLKEIKIKRKKEMINNLKNKSYSYTPKIDKFSSEIIKKKGDYVPLFKRAVEIENEKKMRILIKQKMKNRNFSANNSNIKKRTQKQINEFFNTQMSWKNKVEKENNILKKKLKEKEDKNILELRSAFKLNKSKINKSNIKKKQKSFLTIFDNDINKNSIYNNYLKTNNKRNFGNRLYKDFEKRQKKLNKLKKVLTPSFTPMINKSPNSSKNNSFIGNKRSTISSMDQKNTSLILEYDSSFIEKQKKSRNPKSDSNKKYNKNSLSFQANKKEINNNLKSTAVDSKNTKSHVSFDIFGAKLSQIKEFQDKDEDYSSSDISLNHTSNKNTDHKIYKSSKTNKASNLKRYHDSFNKSKFKSNSFIYNISEDKNESKIENLTNNSITKEVNSVKEKPKNILNQKDYSDNSLKEYNSGKDNLNLNLDDIKPLLDLDQKNNDKESQTPKIGKNISNKSNKTLKSNFKKKSVQIKETKEFKNDDNNNKNIDESKDIDKDNNKSKEKDKDKEASLEKNKKINEEKNKDKNIDNNKSKKSNKNLTKSNQKSPKKKSASKRFSTKEISKNPQNFNKINLNKIKPRAKSIFVNNKNDSSLSNQNKESENTFKNQNDSLDINKELNLENKDSKYINDFLSNKVSSKLSYQDDNLIHNSSYNFESQMFDSKNNLNLNITKKTRRRTLKSYKLNELKDDEFTEEDEEDNEETENKSDTNDIYDKEKDKSFSWIKKLNEIAKNEVTKEIGSFNKKKAGNSTTRPQTKRRKDSSNIDETNKQLLENLDENKLYMLNLRNSSSTGNLNPFTIVAKEPLFYKFFLKKQKPNKEN